MAIFHHKLLILWRKKIIVINIQLPMGSGQLLIPFGYLEVPLPAGGGLLLSLRSPWKQTSSFDTAYCTLTLQKQQHVKLFEVSMYELVSN